MSDASWVTAHATSAPQTESPFKQSYVIARRPSVHWAISSRFYLQTGDRKREHHIWWPPQPRVVAIANNSIASSLKVQTDCAKILMIFHRATPATSPTGFPSKTLTGARGS